MSDLAGLCEHHIIVLRLKQQRWGWLSQQVLGLEAQREQLLKAVAGGRILPEVEPHV